MSSDSAKSDLVNSTKYSGITFKRIHVADLSRLYGPGQRGLVADEKINKGELILKNDPPTSMYFEMSDPRSTRTIDEFYKLVDAQEDPKAKQFLLTYTLQYDDDRVFMPRNYQTRDTIDLSALMNHSCESNCASKYVDHIFALEDIEPGSVLTVDYGTCITDRFKLFPFETCHCGTPSCAKNQVFSRYKTKDWQDKFYEYCSPYVQKQINNIREQQKNPSVSS